MNDDAELTEEFIATVAAAELRRQLGLPPAISETQLRAGSSPPSGPDARARGVWMKTRVPRIPH